VGSFLNVVIWRYPRGESIVAPPSACPACARRLGPTELVPIASWVIQRGRCRGCGTGISVRYPVVEAVTAVVFALVVWRFLGSWAIPGYLVFSAFLISLSGIDLDTYKLPRRIIYLGGLFGIVLLGAATWLDHLGWDPLGKATAGAAIAFTFYLIVHLIAPGAMGFGDVRLSAYLGWHLGWLGLLHVPVGLFLGFLYGAVAGVAMIVVKRAGRKTSLPFGPFMAAGAMTAVLVGRPIIDAWLSN